jgi:DNA polymerase-3 subunit beta
MKLTIEKPALLNALTKTTSALERRSTIPILANVLVNASDGLLELKGTDLDIEVTTKAAATVSELGETTVNGAMLADIVKGAPNGALIGMEVTQKGMTVSFGRSRFKLATLDAEDFPSMQLPSETQSFTIDAPQLARLFGKTSFAMSTEETRYYLNGVYLHQTSEGITAVATDGHKLAKVSAPQHDDFPAVIVPRKTVLEVRKSMDTTPVDVSISQTSIVFRSGDTVIVSKVIDGSFPDYSRVIPSAHPFSVTMDATDAKGAAERVSKVTDDKTRGVALDIADGAVTFRARGGQGEGQSEVAADVDGDAMAIGFNSVYFAQAMAQAGDGQVTVQYKSPGDPCLIRVSDDPDFLAVVMPMRL